MRKTLVAAALSVAMLGSAAAAVDAAPPDAGANKNAVVIGITCEGYNNGEVFEVWAPNARNWFNPVFDLAVLLFLFFSVWLSPHRKAPKAEGS